MIRRWLGSLVNRAVVLVICFTLLSALVVTVVGALLSQSELEQQAKNQVATIAQLVAGELDDKLGRRLETISHVAHSFTMDETVLKARSGALVGEQYALEHLFDAIYLIDSKGNVLAENLPDLDLTGSNLSHRDYFQDASQRLTPVISEPYVSIYQDQPAITIVAPIFDHRQKFIGMLGGALLLSGENFMEDVASLRIGETGYLGVATRSGITLAHGRSGQVMVPVRIGNPVLKDAMEGFEGTRQTRNGDGDRTIMSVQQMAQVPWFVAAVWPAREAFAPITRMTDAFLWTLLGVFGIVTPFALWRFRRLMAPLQVLGQQINERHLGVRAVPVDVTGGREIRRVAEIFNTVMDEREDVLTSLAEREAFFRSVTQSAPIGIIQTDVLGRIDFVNPAFENLIGRPASELQHTYLIEGVFEADREAVLSGWKQSLRNKEVFRGRLRIPSRGERKLIWGDVMTSVIETPDKTLGSITVVRDVSRELEAEEALREEQQRAENILGVLQEGVLMVDVEGRIRFANQTACQFLGAEGDCAQQNFFDLVEIQSDDKVLTHNDFLTGGDIDSLYATLKNRKDGRYDIDLTVLHVRQGRYNERMVFVIRDDSERRRQEERLSWEATHDSLTHLLNRRAFSASLLKCQAEVTEPAARSVLLLIDLDHFKPVNDEGGHLLGDDLLKRLADLFKDTVRQSDTVARLGGDEFGIILPMCGLERAEALAERIRARVEELRIEQDGRSFGVTASIGLTELAPGDSGPREVMARADEGSYTAKSRGRNAVVVMPAPS